MTPNIKETPRPPLLRCLIPTPHRKIQDTRTEQSIINFVPPLHHYCSTKLLPSTQYYIATDPLQPTLAAIAPACLALRPGVPYFCLESYKARPGQSCNLSPPCLLHYDTRPQLPIHLPQPNRLPTSAGHTRHPLHHHRRSRR